MNVDVEGKGREECRGKGTSTVHTYIRTGWMRRKKRMGRKEGWEGGEGRGRLDGWMERDFSKVME